MNARRTSAHTVGACITRIAGHGVCSERPIRGRSAGVWILGLTSGTPWT